MMAPCRLAELKAGARGSIAAGTGSGVSACCVGLWTARNVPSATSSIWLAATDARCAD
jgi:hypothetical protein